MAPEASLFSISESPESRTRENWTNMRKRPITASPQDAEAHHEGWLDVDCLAVVVEVRSEDKDYRVESALAAAEVRGWRAADSGTQTLPRIRRSLRSEEHTS